MNHESITFVSLNEEFKVIIRHRNVASLPTYD